jgi:FkbM family methyltransferase
MNYLVIRKVRNRGLKLLYKLKILKSVKFNVGTVSFYADIRALHSFRYFTETNQENIEEINGFLKYTNACSTLLDVGALDGIFGLSFAAKNTGNKSICIDPSPFSSAILKSNILLNPTLQVSFHEIALGNDIAEVEMVNDNYRHLSVTPISRSNSVTSIKVRVDTIDNFVNERGIEPQVIKIDVEGYEYAVIEGAVKYLDRRKPLLFLEVHPEMLLNYGKSQAELLNLLSDFGYRFFNSLGQSITLVDLVKRMSIYRIICSVSVSLES